MKKKGFLLIEVVISAAFTVIILFMLFNVFLSQLDIYNVEKENINNSIDIQECFNFIEHKLDKIREVQVINNEIIIIDYEENKNKNINNRKIIKLSGNSLVIRYEYKDNYVNEWWHKCTNVIIKPIQQFIVAKEGNIIYATIIDNKGRKWKRSFCTKN